MKRAKKHHFLPQFYLSGFAINGKPKHVWQIEKKPDTKHYQVNIGDAAERSDYHTMTDAAGNRDSTSVEQALSRVEAAHSRLLGRITTKSPLEPRDRQLLARFVALMDMRVPPFKAHVEALHVAHFDAFGKVLLKDDRLEQALKAHAGPKFAAYPPVVQKAYADRLRRAIANDELTVKVPNATLLKQMFDGAQDERLVRLIAGMGVTFFEAPSTAIFVTGDSAVARFYPRRLAPGQHGAGLGDREIQLTIPLSTRFLACLDWSTTGLGYKMATDAAVVEFNRRSIITAQEMIFGSSAMSEVLGLVHANCHLNAGHDVTLQHNSQQGTCLTLNRTIPVFPADCYDPP